MGSDNFRQVGTFDFTEGIGTSVSGTASSFSCSNQSVSDKGFSKESVVTRRSEHSYSEGCVGGGQSSFSSRTVVSYLHTQAVLIHSYLDDSLIKNHCRSLLEEHTNLSILLLLRLGFLISWEKSEIIPSQSFNFLGEHFRTDLGLVLPPEEKVVKVRQLVNALTQFSSVPARQLLQLVGFLISIMDVIPRQSGKELLHIRPIQWFLYVVLNRNGVLAPNFSVVGGTCSNSSSVVTSSSMVASGKTSSEGSFVGSSRPQPNFVHRCESDGLGSLSGGQDSIRPLVRCSVGGTHQSARDESCVSFSPSVSGCDSGSVTTGCHGQLHSSGLSSESRRDPFLFSVSSEQGNSSSVSQSRYNSVSETCSRQSKSSGGYSLPFPCSSEHRMGNSSISVSGDHSLKSLRKGGFSEGATKRISGSVRQSTGAVYDSKWSIFCTWCLSKQIDPITVTVQQLADFFLHLFEEKGYSPSTIKGYRSAIARTISLSGGSDFGDNEFLSLLIKNFCLNRPHQRRLVPSWDLGLVLKVLQFPPFEPLHSASLKFLSYKCCFLIALATGRRRSEIHALSISESCLRFAADKSSVTLLTDPSFLAKNQLPDKAGFGGLIVPFITIIYVPCLFIVTTSIL
ncbi:unnamed protein product [Mytilus edulis]|uniref:Core-binding (CB) domain-containing protein n=1 Tax=Mytilus edulis TaxID=6550 RepID=A0A8S3QKH7_MYTED|nr:unnamed protein product [Mytilus edulis]